MMLVLLLMLLAMTDHDAGVTTDVAGMTERCDAAVAGDGRS